MKEMALLGLVIGSLVPNCDAAQRSATNDAFTASDGQYFTLPEPPNRNDRYTIVIKVRDKETSYSLPAGTRGMQPLDGTVPKDEEWSWRYVLERTELPKLEALLPQSEYLSYEHLARYNNAVLLVWRHLPEAATYRLSVEPGKQPSPSSKIEWGKATVEALNAEEYVNLERGQGFFPQPLRPGERVRWKVTAVSSDGTPLAESDYRTIVVNVPWSSQVAASGWKVQRSDTLSKDAAAKAALFGYSTSQKEGEPRTSAYQTEFALIWDGLSRFSDTDFYPRASVEARLTSSGTEKNNDALRLRAGGYRLLQGFQLISNLKYDTDGKSDTKKGSIELALTPTVAPFGRFYPAPDARLADAAGNFPPSARPWFQVMPLLTVGAEVGRTFDVGNSAETSRSFARERVDLRLEGRLNALAELLRLPSVAIYIQSTYWRLHNQSAKEFTYSRTGMSFQLSPELSLEFAYAVGTDSPTFKFSRMGTVGLGVKF